MNKDEFNKSAYLKYLYKEYSDLIYWIGFDELQNHHDAEEVVQETFVKFIKYVNSCKSDNTIQERNYISRVARNVAHRLYKKRSRYWCYSEGLKQEELSACITEDKSNSLEEYSISNESVNVIFEELEKLDKKYRDPLILQKEDKHTIEEIADILGISTSCVTKRIRKAKQILKEKLRKAGVINER